MAETELDPKEVERVRWRCRRGMLEIDLFLVPFFENCYLSLSHEERTAFISLLEEHDPDLHAYLMANRVHENDAIKHLVQKIRDYRVIVSKNQFL